MTCMNSVLFCHELFNMNISSEKRLHWVLMFIKFFSNLNYRLTYRYRWETNNGRKFFSYTNNVSYLWQMLINEPKAWKYRTARLLGSINMLLAAFRRDLISFSCRYVSKVEVCRILEYPSQRSGRKTRATGDAATRKENRCWNKTF